MYIEDFIYPVFELVDEPDGTLTLYYKGKKVEELSPDKELFGYEIVVEAEAEKYLDFDAADFPEDLDITFAMDPRGPYKCIWNVRIFQENRGELVFEFFVGLHDMRIRYPRVDWGNFLKQVMKRAEILYSLELDYDDEFTDLFLGEHFQFRIAKSGDMQEHFAKSFDKLDCLIRDVIHENR